MSPTHTTCTVPQDRLIAATLTQADRGMVLSYICAPESGKRVTDSYAVLRLPDGLYQITFITPSDLSVIEARTHTSRGLHEQAPVLLPSFTDDLVILVERKTQHAKTSIPGTL
jgi:hypothetical protein